MGERVCSQVRQNTEGQTLGGDDNLITTAAQINTLRMTPYHVPYLRLSVSYKVPAILMPALL